ncbi:hyaluronidase-4-like [Carcharodon carcharias]|uniref:hyaluronidase-4-like n=1 Tax=Carcharodon carcharias TaxID=13397 RepID=UPI001B7E84E7|nr:hyaluronidase-4-like [Carcharodon carcharias]
MDACCHGAGSLCRSSLLPASGIFSMFLCLLLTLDWAQSHCNKQAMPPVMANWPFLVIWNIPTEKCSTHRGVDLHLNDFNIVTNQNEVFMGGNITIFYIEQLGQYPYYDKGHPVHGGCPQNTSLTGHINKMKVDVQKYLPSKFYKGLAVIDWEEWRPQWVRNWGNKTIYREKSEELVRAKYPPWPPARVLKQAQWEFDSAANKFISRTLSVGEMMRPQALWGYYLFPDCYNYHYNSNFSHYDGRCPDIEIERNNQLQWLWSHSKALYPSIYMEEILKSSEQGRRFVRARVQEAMRVSLITDSTYALPVFVYSRSHYAYTFKPMTQGDLIYSIGESAALGASGVILWGSIEFSRTTANCQHVKDYVKRILGPYVVNVTVAAQICSQYLCSKHGRCYRKYPEQNTYLHLSKRSFQIVTRTDRSTFRVYTKGKLSLWDKYQLKAQFVCQCYKGWNGKYCSQSKARNWKTFGSDTGSAWTTVWKYRGSGCRRRPLHPSKSVLQDEEEQMFQ